MTYNELNVVRNLKKLLEVKEQKLQALRELIRPASVKYTRETKISKDGKKGSYTCLDVMPRSTSTTSPTETLATMITDAENRIARLQARIDNEVMTLTDKIQDEVKNEIEQTLLIYRYINCKSFSDIGKLMGFSEGHIYFIHRKILKRLLVDVSRY